MATVIFGNHSAVVLPRSEQDRVRRFYRDVLGCAVTRQTDDKDDIRIGDDFYLGVLYEDDGIVLDEVSFSKSTYLELKVDDVEAMRQRIVDFGVNVLDLPDPHLYFQAPGGQPFRLAGIGEALSSYEGTTSHRVLPEHFR
jgi:catechol 2,3-dioxygenase-like lactoylglutathione lyase family enzyme